MEKPRVKVEEETKGNKVMNEISTIINKREEVELGNFIHQTK